MDALVDRCPVIPTRGMWPAILGVILLLTSGYGVAGTAVSTVKTWPARRGAVLSSDDVLEVTEIGGVSVQPGGRVVAFTTLSADPECNCYHVRLNLLDLRTHEVRVISDLGQPFPVPLPDGSIDGWPCVAEALWSSDGRYLAFIVDRSGHGILFVYDSQTKSPRNLALGGDEAFGFTWARSGDRILYQAGGPQPASIKQLEKGEKEGYRFDAEFAAYPEGMPPVIARVPEGSVFKMENAIFAHDRAWLDLRVVNVVTGTRREATARERAFASTATFSYSEQPHQDATEIESSDGRFTIRLGEPDVDVSGPSITITRSGGAGEIGKTSAEVCPGRQSKRSVASAYWDDTMDRFVLICSRDGASWAVGGSGNIVSLNPVDGAARVRFAIGATNTEGELGRQCDVAAGKMICVREQPTEPPALFALDLRRLTSVQLYDPNAELRRKQFPRVDRLVWNNGEGLPNQADLVYPYTYTSHSRYPLVITQYSDGGFLRGNTGDENPILAYAKSGFFVLSFRQTAPAPEKPGLSFVEREKREWHGSKWRKSIQDSLDIVIQNLVERGLVDPSRVAYTGLSGGSDQIDYALANGRRIAVVITSTCCWDPHAWVFNPLDVGFYDWLDLENPAIDKSRTRWSDVSPVLHVADIHTAILANVSQYERFGFRTLWLLMRYAHKPMETYIYAGEHHVKFQPEHLAAIQHRNIDWLRFWLQDHEDPNPAKTARYARWRRMRDEWCRYDATCVRPPIRR